MSAAAASPEPAVLRLRDLIVARLGLQFAADQLPFLTGVLHACASAGRVTPEQLPERLGSLAEGAKEWLGLIARITVAETYFFRHQPQLTAFTGAVAAQLLDSGRGSLRVLSAGCASGEEPYSLVMLWADHARLGKAGIALEVTALDLNPAKLQRARAGVYSAWALRETPPEMRLRHFTPVGDAFRLAEEVRAAVRFLSGNLAVDDPGFWQPGRFDAIFCRNVLMYFAPAVARAAIARFHRALSPGGYLFLGHAETLRGLSESFRICHTQGAFCYRREDGPQRSGHDELHGPASAHGSAQVAVASAQVGTGTWMTAINSSSRRVAALSAAAGPAAEPAGPEGAAAAPSHQVTQDLLELFRHEQFAAALAAVDGLTPALRAHPVAALVRTLALAHLGAHREAAAECTRLLAAQPEEARVHVAVALCQELAGAPDGARDSYQQALALAPGLALAHLRLALLAAEGGDAAAARPRFARALILLPHAEESDLCLFGGGFGRDTLVELCRMQLAGGAP